MAKRIKTGNSMSNIEGFDEIAQILNEMADVAPKVYEQALEEAAGIVESKILSEVSRLKEKTGQLRGSIYLRKLSGSGTVSRFKIYAGGTAAPHAHLVEFGHRLVTSEGKVVGDVPAHPFMRNGFQKSIGDMESLLKKAITTITDRW